MVELHLTENIKTRNPTHMFKTKTVSLPRLPFTESLQMAYTTSSLPLALCWTPGHPNATIVNRTQ